MTFFATAFAKPMKFALVCFCSISQLNVWHFCLRSVFTSIFQGHMKVAQRCSVDPDQTKAASQYRMVRVTP